MLEAFAQCPMKFGLYRVGHSAGTGARRVGAARALHTAAVRALDECYRLGGPSRVAVGQLTARFIDAFDGRACSDSREEEEYRTAGIQALLRYHADRAGDEAASVDVDVTLRAELGGGLFDSHANRREARPDGSVAFIIYTTARQPLTEGPLQDDLKTAVLQLVAERAEGRPVEVEVHALRKRQVLDATKPPDVLAAGHDRLVALADAALAAERHVAIRGKHCRWCHVRGVCPECPDT